MFLLGHNIESDTLKHPRNQDTTTTENNSLQITPGTTMMPLKSKLHLNVGSV